MIEVLLVVPRHEKFRSRRGDGGSDIQHVELGIVARHHPRADVAALGIGNAAPGFIAGLPGSGNRTRAPQLLAGNGIVSGDDTAVGAKLVLASARGKDLAVGDDGPRGLLRWSLAIVDDTGFPVKFSGYFIQSKQKIVRAGIDDVVAEDRDIPVDTGHRDELAEVFGLLALVLPFEIACGGVDRLDVIAGVRHIHDAVVHQGRAFLNSGPHAAGPDHAEAGDIGARDLVERAVAPTVQSAAPHQPVSRIGILKHRAGDGLSGGRGWLSGCLDGEQRQEHKRSGEIFHGNLGLLFSYRSWGPG